MASVIFLDPYHGPSHAALSTTLRDRSRHHVELLTLPPRKWKWRMRGAALALEPAIRALPPPDLVAATDMLNLPETLALLRDHWGARMPVILYFHENQLTYPVQIEDERDFHFGLANVYSALAAHRVVFNSSYHRDSFMTAASNLIKMMPDQRPEGLPERIRAKSDVLGVPVDAPPLAAAPLAARPPWILWNHRWEEDKDPAAFFSAIRRLDRRGNDFQIVLAGQSFRDQPACFEEARRTLPHRIAHWGYVASRDDYFRLVARCRVAVSTARHEFYGLAVREAIALGCWPLLPRRVVYPEMVSGRPEHLYDGEEELVDRLERLLTSSPPDPDLADCVLPHRPDRVVAAWDAWIDQLAG